MDRRHRQHDHGEGVMRQRDGEGRDQQQSGDAQNGLDRHQAGEDPRPKGGPSGAFSRSIWKAWNRASASAR